MFWRALGRQFAERAWEQARSGRRARQKRRRAECPAS